MRVIPISIFGVEHLLHVACAAGVIHLAVRRIVLSEWLPRLTHLRKVHVLREEDVVVAAEVRARLLPRRDEKILVRRAAGRLAIILRVLEPQRTRIVRVHVAVKIAQADDVESERFHRGEILHRRVERSRRAHALGEPQVEMIHHRLVAGKRLEGVAVRERED